MMNLQEVSSTTFTSKELESELLHNGYAWNDFLLWAAGKGLCTIATITNADGYRRLYTSVDFWEGEDFLEFLGY